MVGSNSVELPDQAKVFQAEPFEYPLKPVVLVYAFTVRPFVSYVQGSDDPPLPTGVSSSLYPLPPAEPFDPLPYIPVPPPPDA